jgi:four helix bundle protein
MHREDCGMPDFRKLRVWQRTHDFCIRIDKLVIRIRRKKPALATQLERAADAALAAIAEGRGRATDTDFARCVSTAIGEMTEAESHVQRAYDAGIIPVLEYDEATAEAIAIRGMLVGLRRTLRGQPRPPDKPSQPDPKPNPNTGPGPGAEPLSPQPQLGPGPEAFSPFPVGRPEPAPK